MFETGDIDWDGAVRAFEADRPDIITEVPLQLTGKGTCMSCKTEDVALFSTQPGGEPDTCTTCRGPVR